MSTILITDSLFLPVGGADEQRLRAAGYDIDRLDVPKADEAALIEHVAGKVGYLLGGIEEITGAVVAAADQLEAIAFTGSGYREFIPAWEAATSRGIAISAARGANASAVADWALVSGLALIRNIPALTSPGGLDFTIGRDFDSLSLGIVGFGAVGHALAKKARSLGLSVMVSGVSDSDDVASVELAELVASADIVSVHVSKNRGHDALDAVSIAAMKVGAVLVNAAFDGAINNAALIRRLQAGELRAAVDYPLDAGDIRPGVLLASNAQTAYNTVEANARVASRATSSLLNLLSTGDDVDLVNPDFKNHR